MQDSTLLDAAARHLQASTMLKFCLCTTGLLLCNSTSFLASLAVSVPWTTSTLCTFLLCVSLQLSLVQSYRCPFTTFSCWRWLKWSTLDEACQDHMIECSLAIRTLVYVGAMIRRNTSRFRTVRSGIHVRSLRLYGGVFDRWQRVCTASRIRVVQLYIESSDMDWSLRTRPPESE